MARTTVVVGVGPGLGSSVARRFARTDDVALLARSESYLETLAEEVGGLAAPADVTDPEAVTAAFERIREELGPVDALVDCLYSTRTEGGGLLETDRSALRGAWDVEVGGSFLCAREAARDVVDGEGGTILLTNSGRSRSASGEDVARSSSRYARRGLAESMARDLGPEGVQVVHAVIEGWIDEPSLREAHPDRPDRAWLDPDDLADSYYHLVDGDPQTFEVDFSTPADEVHSP